LQEFHEQPVGAHLGMNRTHESIRLYTSWPGMKQEIEDYVRQCDFGRRTKSHKTKLPLQITDTPNFGKIVAWILLDR